MITTRDLHIALEQLLFRDNSGTIYKDNNTNEMVLDIAKKHFIELPNKIDTEEKDKFIMLYRKLYKNQ
jgi:hypothetical protein